MSKLTVTTIETANTTTDLTIRTGNTSGPAIVLQANGGTQFQNVSTLSVGNSTSNVAISGNTISINGENLSPVASFRNKIINGNFDFWQRGTSNTSIAHGQYLADRWATGRVGTTGNVSRQSFTLGQTDVPGEPTYFHRSVVTSVAGAGNYFILYQPIESVRTFAGQTATLSFWAKADASKNMAVEFVQSFGTGGSPSSDISAINVTSCALTTSWQKFTVTVNIPSISGKTLGSNNNDFLGIYFWFDAGSNFNSRTNSLGQQSGTFDIAQVQLEVGSVATPFEMRPIGTELALCQRYYLKWHCGWNGVAAGIGYGYSSTAGFPVQMRATPTIGVTSQTNSARYPSSSFVITFSYPYGLTASYYAASTGGNETWYVDGTASIEL